MSVLPAAPALLVAAIASIGPPAAWEPRTGTSDSATSSTRAGRAPVEDTARPETVAPDAPPVGRDSLANSAGRDTKLQGDRPGARPFVEDTGRAESVAPGAAPAVGVVRFGLSDPLSPDAPPPVGVVSGLSDPLRREPLSPDAPPPVEETRARRDRLVDLLRARLPEGGRGAFFLRGAEEDDEGEFRQESSFYYLTGLSTPGASLVLYFDAGSSVERLYLPPADPDQERWVGPMLGAGRLDPATGDPDARRREALRASGFRGAGHTGVASAESLAGDLGEWLGHRGAIFVADPAPSGGEAAIEPEGLPAEIAGRRRQVESARDAIATLRMVKSPSEIAAIRRAVEITCEAHAAAMDLLRPGIPEYALEAAIEYEFTSAGARYAAFPTIVASGPNSTILHYYRNGRTVGENEVVLIDIGAEFARYAADVTRTLPSSGRFTAAQREIHDAVLRAQAAGIALAKPGATIEEIDAGVRASLRKDGLEEYVAHGCCHYVGLDVHDIGEKTAALAPGMVLTVEPGVYVPEKQIGVRIEDTLLVTEGGNEVLSACAPKDAAEIERIMSARPFGGPASGALSRAAPASPRP